MFWTYSGGVPDVLAVIWMCLLLGCSGCSGGVRMFWKYSGCSGGVGMFWKSTGWRCSGLCSGCSGRILGVLGVFLMFWTCSGSSGGR